MRPLLVLLCAGPRRRPGGDPRRDRDRARPHGDARPRRRPRRRAAAPRPADRRRQLRPPPRGRRRRPALLARLRGPRRRRRRGRREPPATDRQVELLAHASVALARGELAQRRDAYDTGVSIERYQLRCELKTAALFECACVIGASRSAAEEAALLDFGRAIGLAFQLLDDVLDVLGPPERTGKARGTDLLDGTVTLPFILARERDPGLLEVDLRALDAADGRAGLRPDRRHRRPRARSAPRPATGSSAPSRRSATPASAARSCRCSSWSPTGSWSDTAR